MVHIFDGFIVLYFAMLGAAADSILDTGKQVGTSSNQVLLGMLVVVLIVVVIYFAKKQDKAYTKLGDKMDAERDGMTQERKARIENLMRLLAENSTALNRTATAEAAMVQSVDSMKQIINTHTEVTKELLQMIRRTNGK